MSGTIERVVVPLDAASESRAAIDTAARLAARAKAPLHGVFVEDEDLLHLASLPFARQSTLGAAAEKLTREHIELHLKTAAERARKDLMAAAERHGVAATFAVVRGPAGTALAAASQRDLIVAGALTRPIGEHFRLGCRWLSSLEVSPGPILLVRHAWSASGTVVVLLSRRDAASARLIETAAHFAEAADQALTVICSPPVAGRQGFEKWIADHLAGSSVRLQVEVAPTDSAALRERLGALGCRMLAIEAGGEGGSADEVRQFVEYFACDILTVS